MEIATVADYASWEVGLNSIKDGSSPHNLYLFSEIIVIELYGRKPLKLQSWSLEMHCEVSKDSTLSLFIS